MMPAGKTPEQLHEPHGFWILLIVLMWSLSVATVACAAGFIWERWGRAIVNALATLLAGV